MKLIKTVSRNRLSSSTLTTLMQVQMLTEDVKEFKQEPAINTWIQAAKRRPMFRDNHFRSPAKNLA